MPLDAREASRATYGQFQGGVEFIWQTVCNPLPPPSRPPPHPFRTKYALTSKRTRIIMQDPLVKMFGHQRPRAPGTNRILGTQQLPTPSRACNPAGRVQRQTGGLGSRKSAVPARAGRKLGT